MKRLLLCLALLTLHSTALSMCLTPDIALTEIGDELPGQTFLAEMQVSAQPQDVMRVLQDIERYPEFMEDLREVKIVSREENSLVVEEALDLPLGKIKRYRLQINYSEDRISWQQLPWPELPESESIADTSGWWALSSLNDTCTQVHYRVYTDPGKVPFGLGWIVDRMTQGAIPGLLEDVRNRVGELAE